MTAEQANLRPFTYGALKMQLTVATGATMMFPIMPTELPPLMLLTINTTINREISSKLFVGLDNAVVSMI